MVIPTVLFGCIPNYSTIGITSTVIIFILRALQGISVGGETSTALVYIYEEAPYVDALSSFQSFDCNRVSLCFIVLFIVSVYRAHMKGMWRDRV